MTKPIVLLEGGGLRARSCREGDGVPARIGARRRVEARPEDRAPRSYRDVTRDEGVAYHEDQVLDHSYRQGRAFDEPAGLSLQADGVVPGGRRPPDRKG